MSLAVAWMVSVPDTAHGIDASTEPRHATGLALVGLESIQLRPRDEAQALAISSALQFATEHPADIGYPYNMVQGHQLGQCPVDGDSGAPVFTLYSDGVAAKGVHSGGAAIGPSCDTFFTDIQLAVQALPGTVKTTP